MTNRIPRPALRAGLFAAVLAVGAAGLTQASEPAPETQSGLSRHALEDAAAYAQFVTEAGALNGKFKDSAEVHRALKSGAAWEQGQIQSGEIAYAALAALQDHAFVEGLRRVADSGQADQLAEQLMREPTSALNLPGADHAAAHASAALAQQADRLMIAGKAVKQSAYDVQHQAWSKQTSSDRPQRLALIKTMSATRGGSSPQASAHLSKAMADLSREDSDRSGPASAVVARGVALAALAVLGRAGDDRAGEIKALMTDSSNDLCLRMAKLNLYQCLAVAGPHYEDLFCLGEHGLKETAACMTKAVSTPVYVARQSVWPDDGRRAAYEQRTRYEQDPPSRARQDNEDDRYAPPPPSNDDRRARRRHAREQEPTRDSYDPTRY